MKFNGGGIFVEMPPFFIFDCAKLQYFFAV